MKTLATVKLASALVSTGLLGISGTSFALPYNDHSQHHSQHPITIVSGVGNTRTTNSTQVGITNNLPQTAMTGKATVISTVGASDHRHDGFVSTSTSGTLSATTGGAANSANTSMNATITNTTTTPPSPSTPPTPSVVKNSNNVNTSNNTSLEITNNNTQTATSGDAKVIGNHTAGSATTGSAQNSSSTTVNVSVSNS